MGSLRSGQGSNLATGGRLLRQVAVLNPKLKDFESDKEDEGVACGGVEGRPRVERSHYKPRYPTKVSQFEVVSECEQLDKSVRNSVSVNSPDCGIVSVRVNSFKL